MNLFDNIKSKFANKQSQDYNHLESYLKLLFDGNDRNVYKFNMKNELLDELERTISEDFLSIVLNDNIFIPQKQVEKVKIIINELKDFKEFYKKPFLLKGNIISVVGKFSAGKTSIINNLFKMGGILPTDIEASTAVPTYIVPNLNNLKPNEEFLAITFTGKIKKSNIEILRNITKSITDKFIIPLPAIIEAFIVPTIGENNFVIVDTPGYNPSDQFSSYDRVRAIESITIADVVFYVVDISDGGLTKDAIEFIKKNISAKEKTLYIIINKADKKPKKAREEIKDFIKQTLENENIKFEDVFLYIANEERQRKIKEEGKDEETIRDMKKVENLIDNLSKEKNKISKHSLFQMLDNLIDEINKILIVKYRVVSYIKDLKENILLKNLDEEEYLLNLLSFDILYSDDFIIKKNIIEELAESFQHAFENLEDTDIEKLMDLISSIEDDFLRKKINDLSELQKQVKAVKIKIDNIKQDLHLDLITK